MSAPVLTLEQQEAASNAAMVEAVAKDGDGCFTFRAILAADFPTWINAANQGDPLAVAVVDLGDQLGAKILQEAENWPVVCGLCSTARLRGTPFLLGLAVSMRDDPSTGLALGLCPPCSVKNSDPRVTVMEAFRIFMPTLRCITVHPEGGRA